MTDRTIRVEGNQFKDPQGRTLLLRGINLGGSSKVPAEPNGATHRRESFFDHRNVSFVGRPFPLDKADEHLARLRSWGFDFLRFLVTWEAVEHAGPGIYDQQYLDYLAAVIAKAGEHGFSLFVDPHQDVWSRFSGGDGAPGWTFEVVGMDVERFECTGAAIVHATHGDPFPRMIWPTNSGKLAAATLFTLFFGSKVFAPQVLIEGEPAQDYLQRHYIGAICQIAERLKGMPHVIGYDTMNEPLAGYIGCQDLNQRIGVLSQNIAPTVLQGMLLGAGYPQQVDVVKMGLTRPLRVGRQLLNPTGIRVWRDGYMDIWQQAGVWGEDPDGQPVALQPDYFAGQGDFYQHYFRPFAIRFSRAIRAIDPAAVIFLEGNPDDHSLEWRPEDATDTVHAGHWYDGVTLYTKQYRPWLTVDAHEMRVTLGRKRVRNALRDQVAQLRRASEQSMGGVPTLVGEFGIPFDMHGGKAFRSGDFGRQVEALDASFRAIEENLLSYTLWNYTADNDNERGDQWNGEDLSIFSRDQQASPQDINSGGRALDAVLRPHPHRTPGTPLRFSFDRAERSFEFAFHRDPAIDAPAEIFVPRHHFPSHFTVVAPGGDYYYDEQQQLLFYFPTSTAPVHTIYVTTIS